MAIRNLKFEQMVKANPAQVYNAFTNATALREWMCNVATTTPRPGGRFYMAWNAGYYVSGEYLSLEKDKAVAFTWQGRNEPRPTQVEIKLIKRKGGTLARVTHKRVGSGEAWVKIAEEYQKGWNSSLENLASVLESGEDLRITRRPMLGIAVGDFNAEVAGRLSVPVSEGMRIDGILEGMGAQAAGLQANDVIVNLAGKEIKGFFDVSDALQGKKAGDQIDVVVYRATEKKAFKMELSRRRMPQIPSTLTGLAKGVEKRVDEYQAMLDKFFEGVSESEASFKPAPAEWSVKEVLAHLIQGERAFHWHIVEIVGGQESWADDYAGNLQAWILATLTAYPSLKDQREQLKQLYIETKALFANLPAEFFQHKGGFWRLSYEALEEPFHLETHIAQMQAALEAARKK